MAASSGLRKFTVFISHAGEDKTTIALPLRDKLKGHGITAFVDEADMKPGTEAGPAMIDAMKTASIAVVVLSPEFVARKWPMKELMCFQRRRQDDGADSLLLIPFFYRLKVGELHDEPRLDREDQHGNPLYHESRFFERMKKREPEASIAAIKDSMQKLHGIMGVRNDQEASNDATIAMSKKREVLLGELCKHIREAVQKEKADTPKIPKVGDGRKEKKPEVDEFHAHYDAARDTSKLVLSFFEGEEKRCADTPEGHLLQLVVDQSPSGSRVIAVHGIGGVGKSSILLGMSTLDLIKERFQDGLYFISLGTDATKGDLILQLCASVERSGGLEAAHKMHVEKDLRKVMERFSSWFARRQCLFMVDDIWQTSEISSSIIHMLLTLHASGRGSKVLMATRNVDIAARANSCFRLEPRDPFDVQSHAILVGYSGIEPTAHGGDEKTAVKEILKKCCGLPLFLAIAGKAVRSLSLRRGSHGGLAYQVYAATLGAQMNSFLDTDIDSYERLQSTLSVSVMLLEDRMHRLAFDLPLTAAKMHRRLSVLEKQARVPMTMLRHLWELSNEAEATIIAREFEQVALADMEVDEVKLGYKEKLRLHDSVHLYADQETRMHGEEKVGHEAIVKGYGAELEMT